MKNLEKNSTFLCKKKNIFISSQYICDGLNDCGDEEDENFCLQSENSVFYCLNNEKSINYKRVCDFIKDCKDGSDEINCS